MNTILFLLYNLSLAVCFCALGYFFARSKTEWNTKPNTSKVWKKYKMGRSVHIVPENDVHEHVLTTGCGCSPKETPIHFPDNTVGWEHRHNALDGRSFS